MASPKEQRLAKGQARVELFPRDPAESSKPKSSEQMRRNLNDNMLQLTVCGLQGIKRNSYGRDLAKGCAVVPKFYFNQFLLAENCCQEISVREVLR